jgi:hypothetical protein
MITSFEHSNVWLIPPMEAYYAMHQRILDDTFRPPTNAPYEYNVALPFELCTEIMAHDHAPNRGRLIIVGAIEFLFCDKLDGYSDIVFVTDCHLKKTIINSIAPGISADIKIVSIDTYMNHLINEYDFVVGCPTIYEPNYPASNHNTPLMYNKITETGLFLASKCAFVLEDHMESGADKFKYHNNRIHKHSVIDPVNISDRVDYRRKMHYVMLDDAVNNRVPIKVDALEGRPWLYPKRPRIDPLPGDNTLAKTDAVDIGVDILHKILSGDKLVFKTVPRSIADASKKWSTSPWLVLINDRPPNGKLYSVVYENDGKPWAMGITAFACDTEKQANTLKEWLQDEEIRNDIASMFEAKNVRTLSLEILKRLPYYE